MYLENRLKKIKKTASFIKKYLQVDNLILIRMSTLEVSYQFKEAVFMFLVMIYIYFHSSLLCF